MCELGAGSVLLRIQRRGGLGGVKAQYTACFRSARIFNRDQCFACYTSLLLPQSGQCVIVVSGGMCDLVVRMG